MSTKPYDVIIFGATSFVGNILARYMAKTYGASGQLRWAIAGRDETKLQAVQKAALDICADSTAPPILIADSHNSEQIDFLCKQARVIISTVGPFALYGETLVRLCVENGTDYCDSTGEVHWVLQMISKYQEQAAKTGARIVNCCGFDSIPSDLGVYFTHLRAEEHLGRTCDDIDMRVAKMKGAFSGGTYASLLNAVKESASNPGLRKALNNPYCLCPSDHPFTMRQKNISGADFDEHSQSWMTSFVMAGVNTRIVHRSNALFDYEYGDEFRYSEALLTGSGPAGRKRASRAAFGLKALIISATIPPARWLLSRFILPKPGEGPSEQEQLNGSYLLRFYGKVAGKGTIVCSVEGDLDPGYGSTAKMLGQAAVSLCDDVADDFPGGFWTPARIFSDRLIERLQAHAGITFTIESVDPS